MGPRGLPCVRWREGACPLARKNPVSFPELHLSKPGVAFPTTSVDNAEIIRRVRERFKGPDEDFAIIQSAIQRVFRLCRTRQRFLEPDVNARVADYAVAAAKQCLEVNAVSLDEVDPQTMRSRVIQGLYLCGEVLDIAGPIGGYNLQAAFSTGYVAGETAARDLLAAE